MSYQRHFQSLKQCFGEDAIIYRENSHCHISTRVEEKACDTIPPLIITGAMFSQRLAQAQKLRTPYLSYRLLCL